MTVDNESNTLLDLKKQVIEEQRKELFRRTMLQINYLAAKYYSGDAKNNLSEIINKLEKEELDCFVKTAIEFFSHHMHLDNYGLTTNDDSALLVEEELASLEKLNAQEMLKFKAWFAKIVTLLTITLGVLFAVAWLQFDFPWIAEASRIIKEIRSL